MTVRRSRALDVVIGALAALAVVATAAPPAQAQVDDVDPSTLVAAAYEGLLGRAPDPGGERYWTDRLDTGTTPQVVLAELATSAEHRDVLVRDAYRDVLGRAPDPGGARWWRQELDRGTSALGLRARLLASEELFATAGDGTDAGFVRALYDTVLGRTPDGGGLRHWTARLDAGTARAEVARALLTSQEALARADLPVTSLSPPPGRPADTLELTVDLGPSVEADAATLLVSIDGRRIAGTTRATDGTLRFTPDAPPDLALGAVAPVDVAVLGLVGDQVRRADTGFRYRAPSVISTFTTSMTPGQNRTVNIQQAARYLDGSVIAPGATLSLNAALGERTRARGFLADGMISDGEIIDVVGGGVSQMATTFMNAAWFAGIRIDRFRQHTIYFERYPMCREATIVWDLLDVVVTNDTPTPITVRSSATDSSVTVTFVGRPWARVDSWTGAPFDVAGPDGAFTVECGRTITYPDGTTRSVDHRWRYREGYPG
ncbi:MAG TPA: VanW family protein [Acidimicrobiales bacterium]|nr:VanW family protein [Acidimicrobiales bacterium]